MAHISPRVAARRAAPRGVRIAVDNTWLTALIYNPLERGDADVVVESLTKHVSDGGAIMGAIIGHRRGVSGAVGDAVLGGLHVSPLGPGCHLTPKALDLAPVRSDLGTELPGTMRAGIGVCVRHGSVSLAG